MDRKETRDKLADCLMLIRRLPRDAIERLEPEKTFNKLFRG